MFGRITISDQVRYHQIVRFSKGKYQPFSDQIFAESIDGVTFLEEDKIILIGEINYVGLLREPANNVIKCSVYDGTCQALNGEKKKKNL